MENPNNCSEIWIFLHEYHPYLHRDMPQGNLLWCADYLELFSWSPNDIHQDIR